jgi:hypothetical protein
MPVARRYDPVLRAQAEVLMDQGLKDGDIADRIGIAGDRGRAAVNWWRRHRRPSGAGERSGEDADKATQAPGTPGPAGGSALSPDPRAAKDGASIGRPGPAWRGSQAFQGWDFGGGVGRADFTRLLLLAARCQKQAAAEAEESCYADQDPECLADLALSIAARMLGLELPDQEEEWQS